jgi:hypothetical protein
MKIAPEFTGLVLMITVAGCGVWTRPNTSEAEFYQDRYQCEQEAVSMYPVAMRRHGGTVYQTPTDTDCNVYGNQISCTTSRAPEFQGMPYDANEVNRILARDSCLRARGYVWR